MKYEMNVERCANVYRVIFVGIKCSWFLLIKHVLRTVIPTNLIPHACMLAKATIPRTLNPSKGLSAKVYTDENYPLYGKIFQENVKVMVNRLLT